MAAEHVLNIDLANVYSAPDKKKWMTSLVWGDEVEVVEITARHVEIRRAPRFVTLADGSIQPQAVSGFIKPSAASGVRPRDIVIKKADAPPILKVDFVDVQQGDGAVIETPQGKVMLIDGGDNQLFARYLAGRYRGTKADSPKEIDCILVTHGDADHFAGLTEIYKSETNRAAWKQIYIHPRRVYHNGLVKRPDRFREIEILGPTQVVDGTTIITGLETDLLAVDNTQMNRPFQQWKTALRKFQERGPIEFRRLAQGDNAAFDFLADENIEIEVLGPILTKMGGIEGLKFLGEPVQNFSPGVHGEAAQFTGKSASHTINGHSIVFRLKFGNFHFLFAGDLNEEAEVELIRQQQNGQVHLQAEVFKVPHHGSADFLPEFLEAVAPVISVVSSGDESARKEYIHPRATLMGALGKYSRLKQPLIFVTELVAFFEMKGFVQPEFHTQDAAGATVPLPKKQKSFFAFQRAAFGIVRVRTDGNRILVFTNSGQSDLKEAYAFTMAVGGEPVPAEVRNV